MVRPSCGNGKCDDGESAANCCNDCGCPEELTCSNNVCRVPGVSTMTVILADGCKNGEAIEWRLFDKTKNGVWPDATHVYKTQNNTTKLGIACSTNDTICYGARQKDHNRTWGAGIEGNTACESCCTTCGDKTMAIGTLSCD